MTAKNHVRARRVRSKLRRLGSRPRLTVFRSNQNIYCQVIDDAVGKTIAAVNTLQAAFSDLSKKSNVAAASLVGQKLGEFLLSQGVSKLMFDKGPYAYHGRVKAVAEGVRTAGVEV